jgi:hypothetical protein
VIRRLRGQGLQSSLTYALGRFRTVRTLYSAQAHMLRGIQPQTGPATIFPDVNVDQAVNSIRRDSVYWPVRLPADLVAQFREIASTAVLASHTTQEKFKLEDVKNGHLGDGAPIMMAYVVDVDRFEPVQRVINDPVVKAVMSNYLRYTPDSANTRLFWSFAAEFTPEQRKKAVQTVEYHFDVHSYNFAYSAYYITDTNRDNGAHVMVVGSHKDKPASWLFGSSNRSDADVEGHYGKERVLCIEGPAGTGFWQDSSCYHKALAPAKGDRLMLQVRYA